MPISPIRRSIIALCAGIACLAVAASGADAQTATTAKTNHPATTAPAAAPTAAPVSSEPNNTTASFGDWILRCQRVGDGENANRVCEVAQTMQVQGQAAPIAQIALGRAAASEPLRVTVVLPTAISLPSSVQIALDKDTAPFELSWRRCVPGGCFADAVSKDDVLARWRASSQPGRIVFKDATGRDAAIPLSFRGLAPALDALAKEPG